MRADLALRLGLLSLLVPVLGPFVWLSAARALDRQEAESTPERRRLVRARWLGMISTVLLVGIASVGLLAGQPVAGP